MEKECLLIAEAMFVDGFFKKFIVMTKWSTLLGEECMAKLVLVMNVIS